MTKDKLMKRLDVVVLNETVWSRLEDYLLQEKDDLLYQLTYCDNIRKSNLLQGKIQVIDGLLVLPDKIRNLN